MRNSTLTLPDPQFAKGCGKGGSVTFVDGAATVGTATWKIAETTPVEGDLDGLPGAELVTTLSCSVDNYVKLLALRADPSSGNLSVLGYVLPSGSDLMSYAINVRIDAGVVQVTTTGTGGHTGPRCHAPLDRGYSYKDGGFKQTSGATAIPEAPMDVRKIDLRSAALALFIPDSARGGSWPVCVGMKDGTGTGVVRMRLGEGPVTYTFTIQPSSFATGGNRDFAIALVTHRAGDGPEIRSVQAISRMTDSFEGHALLYTGVDGVTSIDDVKVNDNRVVVTVTANGAKRTWTYAEKPPGSDVWART